MILNKKRLIFGLTLGTLGIALYNSIKNHEEKLKYVKIDTSKQSIDTDNSSYNSRKQNEIITLVNILKKQASLLEDRLDELKK